MTFTLTYGWWVAPIVVTLAMAIWAFPRCSPTDTINRVSFFSYPFSNFAMVSLSAWLIWSLLT